MSEERSSGIKLRVENVDYDVVGGDFQQNLEAVKALPGRRYVGEQKLWVVPGSLAMVRGQLENSGFSLEGGTPASAGDTAQNVLYDDRIGIEVAGYQAIVTGGRFQDMLVVIKGIQGRRFDGETKRWSLPGTLTEIKDHFAKEGLRLENLTQVSQAPSTSPESSQQPLMPSASAKTITQTPPSDPLSIVEDPGFGYQEGIDYGQRGEYEQPFESQDILPSSETSSLERSTMSTGRRDQIRVVVGNESLVVVGGRFKEMLVAVKEIPDRRFDSQTKQWFLPNDINSIQQHLNSKGFRLEEWQS